MTWKTYMTSQVAISFLCGYSTAYDKDWYNSDIDMGVQNGTPYSREADIDRFIEAPLAVDDDHYL